MANHGLEGARIFVAEDEYFIATEISETLTQAGAHVLGPVPSIEAAYELLSDEPRIDAAVLDVNLGGQMVFEIADTLRHRAVPLIFATGYDAGALPPRFTDTPRLDKPLHASELKDALAQVLEGQA